MYKIIFLALMSLSVQASVPNAEGLFRNANNKEYSGTMIVLKMIVERIENKNILEATTVADEAVVDQKELKEDYDSPEYIKFIVQNIGQKKKKIIQVHYNDKAMKEKYFKMKLADFDLEAESTNHTKKIFYSLLSMYLGNSSEYFSNILQQKDATFRTNNQEINFDKRQLYESYKKYLIAIKADESIKEELRSPLDPEDKDEKKRVEKLIKTRMYNTTEHITLVRENNKMYWDLNYEDFYARFSYKKHQLKKIVVGREGNKAEFTFSDYIMYDGVHELPRKILVKNSKNIKFQITPYYLISFKNKGKNLIERAKDYHDGLSVAGSVSEVEDENLIQEKSETVFPFVL